jgi:hypothetical protein
MLSGNLRADNADIVRIAVIPRAWRTRNYRDQRNFRVNREAAA